MKPRGQARTRDPSGHSLWARVTATVRPFPGRKAPPPATTAPPSATAHLRPRHPQTGHAQAGQAKAATTSRPPTLVPHEIEPGRRRRMVAGRDGIEGRMDLHGMTHDEARAALTGFVQRAHVEGRRTLLVITGKGTLGEGVLRRRAPQWLAEAPLRGLVAGVGEAHRRHGGAGALYVLLKKRLP